MIPFENVKNIYVGETEVSKVYQGTDVIYEKAPSEHCLTVTGGQYIDTNVKPNNSTVVEMKIKATPRTTPSAKFDNMRFTQAAFGARSGYMSNEYVFWYDYAGPNWQTQAGSGSVIYSMANTNNVNALPSYPAWNKDCVVKFEYGKFTLTYDGVAHEHTITTSGTVSLPPTLYLFNLHSSENLTMWFNGDWYYTKIWKNNNLVRDYVPTLDNNNVPCMYDNVSQTYFYNLGTGDFIYK